MKTITGKTATSSMTTLLTTLLMTVLAKVVYSEEGWRIVDHGDHTHRYRITPNENIYGSPLNGIVCSTDPMTGWFRDGTCKTGPNDRGTHVVCAEMTQDFLEFTKSRGNDLSTPRSWGFPGLRPGDKWCLCALRWTQAWRAGKAPPVVPQATHKKALQFTPINKQLLEACSQRNWLDSAKAFKEATCYS